MTSRHQPVPDGEEASVVYVSRWQQLTDADGTTYLDVTETMNTPFIGPGARRRAESFLVSEEARGDFPEADGWRWFVHSNRAANTAYGKWFTDQLFGADPDPRP